MNPLIEHGATLLALVICHCHLVKKFRGQLVFDISNRPLPRRSGCIHVRSLLSFLQQRLFMNTRFTYIPHHLRVYYVLTK